MIQVFQVVAIPPDRGVLKSSKISIRWANTLFEAMHENLKRTGSPSVHHVRLLRELGYTPKSVVGVVNVGTRLNWWKLTRTDEKNQNMLTLLRQVR